MRHAATVCLLLFLVVASACADRTAETNTSLDTSNGISEPGQTPSSSGTLAGTPPAPIGSAARAACAASAALWRSLPGAIVTERDTILRPGDAIGDSVIHGSEGGPPRNACVVHGQLAQGADSSARDRLSWIGPDGQRGRNGWGNVWHLAADGADGFVQTYQRGRTRCQLRAQWEPGDPSDSTFIPDPLYREQIACWRHGRDLAPADTAQENPRG